MKNKLKFLGIITLLVVIGLILSCEVAPEDQVIITVTGIPSEANDKYAIMGLYSDLTTLVAVASAPKRIRSGSVYCEMIDAAKKEAFGKEGGYFVGLVIYKEETMDTLLYKGSTSTKAGIKKGENPLDANKFSPDIENFFANAPGVEKYGTYTTLYSNITETVILSGNEVKISDNSATKDKLTFEITKWEDAAVPSDYASDYEKGYKFTGKLTEATAGWFTAGGKTLPADSFSAADAKADSSGPVCWMYIYFNGTGNDITFVRTPFSKTGYNENTGVVTGSETPPQPRVYTQK